VPCRIMAPKSVIAQFFDRNFRAIMIKRLIDLSFSFLAAVVLAPVFVALAIAVRLSLGSPVLFRQVRPGLNGEPFAMFKFRTMKNLVDESGNSLPDKDRLTRFGAFMRSTSLDELPALWNVLIGDMSLVGPRPLLMQYLPLYTPSQARRHDVKPGVTGWAQINGRNAISWEEKFELDLWYVENRNIWLDCRILFLTVIKVFRRDGINAEGEATMPAFNGTHSHRASDISDVNFSRK
jgi:lipopolysaccharide/colanic/teichoic acid biosynthesis glycosyltransferase